MPKEIKAWQDASGGVHETECAAACADIDFLARGAPIEMTEATRRQLAGWLREEWQEITDTLLAYSRACPNTRTESLPLKSSERTLSKGPGFDTQATSRELAGHKSSCKARLSGFFRDCDCGFMGAQSNGD